MLCYAMLYMLCYTCYAMLYAVAGRFALHAPDATSETLAAATRRRLTKRGEREVRFLMDAVVVLLGTS